MQVAPGGVFLCAVGQGGVFVVLVVCSFAARAGICLSGVVLIPELVSKFQGVFGVLLVSCGAASLNHWFQSAAQLSRSSV